MDLKIKKKGGLEAHIYVFISKPIVTYVNSV